MIAHMGHPNTQATKLAWLTALPRPDQTGPVARAVQAHKQGLMSGSCPGTPIMGPVKRGVGALTSTRSCQCFFVIWTL